MRPRTGLFGTLGALATSIGVGLLLVPDLLLGIGPLDDAVTAFAAVETTTVGLVAGFLVLLAFLVTARSRPAAQRTGAPSSVDSRYERAATAPPERPTAGDQSLTGAALDNDVNQAIRQGGEAFRDVRAVLYEAAAKTHAERMAVPESRASAAIDRGEWTDDPVASRFLDQEREPLSMRLRGWLTPEQERERRIERTVAAIERVSRR